MIVCGSLLTWVQLIGEQGIRNRVTERTADIVRAVTSLRRSGHEVTRPSTGEHLNYERG